MAQQNYKDNPAGPKTAHSVAYLANGSTSAASNTAGIPVILTFDLADAATATYSYVIKHKFEITNVEVQKRSTAGGASDTVQVLNGTDAVTNAMSLNIADKAVVRWGTIDDAYSTIAAGGTLAITLTKASTNVACMVVVTGVRRS
jgi:hypothetical protein